MKCTKCGYIVPEDSDFCQFCGARIELQPEVAPVVETAAPDVSAKEITEAQRYFDSDYGYSPENPIVTSSVHMVGYYLRALRTEDGHSFTWERQPNRHGNMIDEYQLFVDGTPYKTVFFNPHGEDRDFIPAGLVRDSDAFAAAQQGVSLEDYQAQLATKEQKKARKKKRTKRWIIAISIVLTLALAITLLFVLGGPSIKYLYAKHLLRSGNYDSAYSAFYDLGSFKDAEEMLLETRYQEAVALRNAKDFDAANQIFKDLGEYKDSKELIHYHLYKKTVDLAATCTTAGTATKTCSCGTTETEKIPATGHKTETVSTTPATCTATGQKVLRCVNCGEKTTETIQLKSHNYATKITSAATCQSTGTKTYTCTGCGKSYTEEIAKTNHAYVAKTTKAASCQSAGTKTYTCSGCGKSYTEELAQTGHEYTKATCTAAKTCKGCGKTEGSALGHTNTAICTRCGKVLFSAITYTGYGPGNVTGINLPKGSYNITYTHMGSGGFIVDFCGQKAPYYEWAHSWGPTSQVSRLDVTKSEGEKNAYFNVTSADGRWAIAIQAVG